VATEAGQRQQHVPPAAGEVVGFVLAIDTSSPGIGHRQGLLGSPEARRRQTQARVRPPLKKGLPNRRELGDAHDCHVMSFPSSGWMFASPPFAEAGFGISRVLGSAAPHDTPRIDAVADQLALPNRVAPRAEAVDECGTCRHHRSEVVGVLTSHPPARPWAGITTYSTPALASGLGMAMRPASCLTDLVRSIAERDAQQKSWHWLDGAGALWSDEVI
jgi:hypothetical protein